MSPSRRRKRGAPARARALTILAENGAMSTTQMARAMYPERFDAAKEQALTDAGVHLAELKRQKLVRRRLRGGVQVWERLEEGAPGAPSEAPTVEETAT